MKTRAIGCIVVTATALAACGEVTVTGEFGPPLNLVQDESPEGIYSGNFTDTSGVNPLVQPVIAIVDADGNIQLFFSMAAERHIAGRVEVTGNSLTGSLTEYSGRIAGFTGVGGIAELAVQGSVSAGSGITGDYSVGTRAGRIVLDYDASYEVPSSLDLTAGTWSYSMISADGSVYTVTWEVDGEGRLFGADTVGCVFVGRVSVPDESVNAYGLGVQVDSCGYFNGDYAGQAFFNRAVGQGFDRLTLGVANDVFAFTAMLQREAAP